MKDQNEIFMYDHIHKFINQFEYIYESGITLEIEEVFSGLYIKGEIKSFTLLFDNDNHHYRVVVTLEECSQAETHGIFWSFIHFISYSGATISAKKQTEKGVHYVCASFSEDGRGFCCEVDFLAEEVGAKRVGRQSYSKDTSLVVSALNSDPNNNLLSNGNTK